MAEDHLLNQKIALRMFATMEAIAASLVRLEFEYQQVEIALHHEHSHQL